MANVLSAIFDHGTLALGAEVAGARWDPRTASFRLPAHALHELIARAAERGVEVRGDPRASWSAPPATARDLALRPYQRRALAAWEAADRRGVVCLPTGAGKTRVAIAAIRACNTSTAILCPTRALASAWVKELPRWFSGPIGHFADGLKNLGDVSVMTFESAYRHMDLVGDRFGLLVVDECHHFASGARTEALMACAATARLGLSATPPMKGSEAAATLERQIGPVAYELEMEALVGTHLADMTLTRITVRLEEDERRAYVQCAEPFRTMRRAFMRSHPDADFVSMMRALSMTKEGRRAIRLHANAQELACFPREKRARVRDLLRAHRGDKTIVFTAYVENAYQVALDNLIPVIAADTGAKERQEILAAFAAGDVRAIASARVLNEGIDIPDASVAIIVAGSLGRREHVQRIGRVLRPAEDKIALVYELVTHDTFDARRAEARSFA